MRHLARFTATLVIALLVAACGSGAAPTTAPATQQPSAPAATAGPASQPPASAPASQAPANPATATLTFTGDPHLAAGQTLPVVQCSFPSPNGLVITVVTAAADKSDAAFVTVTADRVTVRLSAGTGTAITARDFEGNGVEGFDVAKGATLNAHLTETTKAGVATGTLPVLQAVSGTISCGGQTPGSGSVHVTATLPEGKIDGDLAFMRVVCNADASGQTTVAVAGLADVGTSKLVLGLSILPSGAVTLYVPTLPSGHILTATTAGAGTVTGQGGTFNADVTGETASITGHITGSVTCGSQG